MRAPLNARLLGTTNGSTAANVDLPAIKPGQLARITHLALQNASGESVTAAFGIESMGSFNQIWANQTVADSDAYGTHVDFLLLEGDKLRCEVTGTAKSGPVTFSALGELIDQTPEVVTVTEVQQ